MWVIQLYFTWTYIKDVEIIGAMAKVVLASAIMYGILLLSKSILHFSPILNVLVYAMLGGIIYLIAILLLKVVDTKEIKQIIGKS